MNSEMRRRRIMLKAWAFLSLAFILEPATAEEVSEYGDVDWGMSMEEVRKRVPGGTVEKNIVKGSTFYKSSRASRNK